MSDERLTARLGAAEAVAREAGQEALSFFRAPETISVKAKGRQDFVSQVDGAVERLIRERLAARFSDDGFIGEEDGADLDAAADAGIWVIDPIDGTANFVSGVPVWCVSIAYVVGDVIELGVIYDPNREELYSARRGQGAWRNGRQIRASRAGSLDEGTVGIGYSPRTAVAPVTGAIERLLTAGGMYQNNGSGALMLAYVAAGRLIGYCEAHINAWDCLAGILLVNEAGGWTSDFLADGGLLKGNPIVAAAPGVAEALSRIADY